MPYVHAWQYSQREYVKHANRENAGAWDCGVQQYGQRGKCLAENAGKWWIDAFGRKTNETYLFEFETL